MNTVSGIEQEFVDMIQQQEALLHKVCHVYESDADGRKDLFQEIVLQAWRAYPTYRREAKVGTWLYRIALNTAISQQRKLSRSPINTSAELHFDHADAGDDGLKEQYKMLETLISKLPPLDKALVLLYLEDKKHHEIAEILGISTSNAGTRLARIREKLKKQAQPLINQ
jgi:RNA polymerase sigma-70 factor (ECF subfamily)